MARRPTDWRRVYRNFPAFEWDAAKSAEIERRHGFDLHFASLMFPAWVLEREDTRAYDERRFQVLGEVLGEIVILVYTLRHDDCRIITAWPADEFDRSLWLAGRF